MNDQDLRTFLFFADKVMHMFLTYDETPPTSPNHPFTVSKHAINPEPTVEYQAEVENLRLLIAEATTVDIEITATGVEETEVLE